MIESQRLQDSVLLFLPLCPSTNARMGVVRMGGFCRQILTKEARDYISSVGTPLAWWKKASRFPTLDNYFALDLWYVLPRINCDASNYGKVLFDALEEGGIVSNDKYILPRVRGIWHDKQTVAVVKLPWRK